MITILPVVSSLIVSSANVVSPAVPGPVQEALHPNKRGPNTADENKPGWKSTASATTVGSETPQMLSIPSNLSPGVSVLSWNIAR